MSLLVICIGLAVFVAWVIGIAIRRDRRHIGTSDDGLRIEASAVAEARDARRRARVGRGMHSSSTLPFRRDHNPDRWL